MQHSGLQDGPKLALYNMLQAERDEDGDLVVTRTHDEILMHHGLATLLNDVGLQVRTGCMQGDSSSINLRTNWGSRCGSRMGRAGPQARFA